MESQEWIEVWGGGGENIWEKGAQGKPLIKQHDCLLHTEPGTDPDKLFQPPQAPKHASSWAFHYHQLSWGP